MDGNESAFPVTRIETDLVGDGSGHKFPHVYTHSEGGGLTKRELFAAMAMQGLMSCFPVDPREASRMAVQHADALVAALAVHN